MELASAGSTAVRMGINAYTNRHRIYHWWTVGKAAIGAGDTQVAITGRAGVEKSLLADAMEGPPTSSTMR